MARRAGNPTAFWNNASTGAGGNSSAVEIPREATSVAIWITVNGATTVTVQAASDSPTTTDGVYSDANPANWANLYWLGTQVQFVFAGSGSACILIPNCAAAFLRLSSTNSVTATAGYEAS